MVYTVMLSCHICASVVFLSHAYLCLIVWNVFADMSVNYKQCCLVSDCTVTDHIHVFFSLFSVYDVYCCSYLYVCLIMYVLSFKEEIKNQSIKTVSCSYLVALQSCDISYDQALE